MTQKSMPAAESRLTSIEVSGWPKLAWAAIAELGADTISVLHGSYVETNPDWCVEAVWPGEFSEGGFDLTDVVVGTGVRVRNDKVLFVSSSDTLNRLHHFQAGRTVYVSNSLSALMAIADLALVEDYDYVSAMESIKDGVLSYVREIPSSRGPIHLTYFNNLVVADSKVVEAEKPSSAPNFTDFATYREYLFASARHVGANARASGRRHGMGILASISSGYDSPAAAILAREAGAREAVTISHARRDRNHLFNLDDSGVAAAKQLGMPCKVYARGRQNYPFEDALWASMGSVGDLNLAIFDYPQELSLLFTGFMGDTLWAKEQHQSEPLRRKDTSGARFSECRLELGVFNCSPVCWGCRNEGQLHALTKRREMLPWTLGTDYDRPIPRRLAEEAGIARTAFGTRKRMASFNRRYGRPLSTNLRADFAMFLERRGKRGMSGFAEWLSLLLRAIDTLVLRKLPRTVRFSCRNWVALPRPSMFFIWANERRKRRYLESLPPSAALLRDTSVNH